MVFIAHWKARFMAAILFANLINSGKRAQSWFKILHQNRLRGCHGSMSCHRYAKLTSENRCYAKKIIRVCMGILALVIYGSKMHLIYFRTSYLVSLLYLLCVFFSIFLVLSIFKRKFAPYAIVNSCECFPLILRTVLR